MVTTTNSSRRVNPRRRGMANPRWRRPSYASTPGRPARGSAYPTRSTVHPGPRCACRPRDVVLPALGGLMRHRYRVRGFTLIELMITLAVIVVLLLIAVPSFQSFRQRAALRGGAEQAMSLWQQARFEAAKRNSYV